MQRAPGWYLIDRQGERRGPFPPEEFRALVREDVIGVDTPIWTEGCADWVVAADVPGLLAPAASPALPVASPGASDPIDAGAPALAPGSPPPLTAAPSATTTPDPMPDLELKPRKGSFIFPRVMPGVIIFALLAAGAAVALALSGITPWIGLLIFVLGVGLCSYAARMAYRKERYELHHATVVCHRGGLMSDQTTELEIRNITHVKLKLPWLRFKFFGVGDVIIESAGNAQPVVLRAIRGPLEIYSGMRERMKRNGYDLNQRELLHEEKPAIIGVVVECLGMAGAAVMVTAFGFPGVVAMVSQADLPWTSAVLPVVGVLWVAAAVATVVLRFLDLRRRTYRVFNDVVVYEEGFLTRQNAFIPYENIADAATKRSFVDQILSLFDVVISCQGSSSEIKFRRLQHGVQLSNCIDQLVLEAGRKPKPAGIAGSGGGASVHQVPRRAEPELVAPGDAWIADLKMNGARVFVPLLLLAPLVPIWILATIQAAIKLMGTSYAVRPGSIRHSYRFLSTNDREFAYDKITGLVIKESPWDRMFGTVTLRFWSIGSGQSLELAHVSKKLIDFDAIRRQIGIPEASAHPCEVRAAFSPVTWLRARCIRLTFAALVVAGLVVAGVQSGEAVFHGLAAVFAVLCVAGFAYAWAFFSRQRLRFHDHHVEAGQGVITRHRYFARYRNVKKAHVTRYPGGHEGSVQVFVAGEQQVGQQGDKKGQKGVSVPCSFTLGFLPNAMNQGQLLDDILCGRVHPGPEATPAEALEILFETPRSVGNSVMKLLLASIILFPLIVLLPITLPYTVMAVKRWRYRLEAGRITATWGILFRHQLSIILDRVDSLQQQQGPVNKMFKNGNVSIMTAGSSRPDLVMPNASEFGTLYKEIRARSQGG